MHVNYLELLAIFAVRSFIRSYDVRLIKVLCDNSTAVTYINNVGGMVPSLNGLTVQVWQWCLDHHCLIEASYLPERENNSADFSSWEPCSRLDWKLHPDVFSRITEVLFMPDTDLFATRFNTELKQFVSWKPDPDGWFYNAFSRSWSDLVPYVFPPFSLIGRCSRRFRRTKCKRRSSLPHSGPPVIGTRLCYQPCSCALAFCHGGQTYSCSIGSNSILSKTQLSKRHGLSQATTLLLRHLSTRNRPYPQLLASRNAKTVLLLVSYATSRSLSSNFKSYYRVPNPRICRRQRLSDY